MRHLVLGSLGRRISWALIWALVLPLLTIATPRQARAQSLVRATPVAVLDFGVLAKTGNGSILGRSATDAVVVEMTRTGRFDVIPRTQLNQQLQELGLAYPLSNNAIQKLGGALGVEIIVDGDVTKVVMHENPRRAEVSLSVRVTDVASGELTNGTIESGYSSAPAPGQNVDDETLVSQAASEAAFNAIKTINNYQLPEATILQSRDETEVTLNRGGRDGITVGLEMVVIRGRERVGRLRVTNVESTSSIATVTDHGKGIRPEDRARAVFKLPGYNVDPTGLRQSTVPETQSYKAGGRKQRPVLVTVLLVAAAVILATYLFNNRSNTNNAGGTGSITARAYAEGAVTTAADPTASRVEITWSDAPAIPANNILEYQIFRDGLPIGVTTRGERRFVDRADIQQPQISLRIIAYGGNPNANFPGNVGDTTAGTTTGTTTTTNTTGTTGTTTGTNTGTNSTGPAQPDTLTTVIYNVTPLQVGRPHTYSVRTLYVRVQATRPSQGGSTTAGGTTGGTVSGGTGGNNGVSGGNGQTTGSTGGSGTNSTTILYGLTNLNRDSGSATPIVRPSTAGPTADQNLRSVRVSYQTVTGADQYIVEFATDPSFNNKKSFGPFFQSTVTTTAQTDPINVQGLVGNLSTGQRVYYRVGARSSLDTPGPIGRFSPNGSNYIYSANSQSFGVQGTPPSPPG